MTDDTETAPPQPATPGVDFVVSAEQLISVDPDAVLADLASFRDHDIHRALGQAAEAVEEPSKAALHLLAGLVNYTFHPDSKVEPFAPMWMFEDRRSLVPADFLSEQIGVLAEVAPSIKHPCLRARIADVAWFQNRKNAPLGFLAVDSYCDCVDALRRERAEIMSGRSWSDDREAVGLLKRAAHIANALGWRKTEFDRLRQTITDMTQAAFTAAQHYGFRSVAELNLDWSVTPPSEIARMARELAEAQPTPNAEVREILWKVAARAHHHAKDETASKASLVNAAECIAEKARTPGTSLMLKATFLSEAIEELLSLPGTKERREELHQELRQIQPGIRDEMGTFSHPMDITAIVEESLAAVRGRSLFRALLQLLVCNRVRDPDELENAAQETRRDTPLYAMIAATVHDHQGRLVYRAPGLGLGEASDKEHLKFQVAQDRRLHRHLAVAGAIDPIRRLIVSEHAVGTEYLLALVGQSPFVPPEHAYIFARGALHFLGGEDVEAAHLLIPQLENSLRHILGLAGIDTTTIDQDGIQEETPLSVLLSKNRADLEKMMGPGLVHEIDLLFNFRGGPNARNELAHGKIPAGAFWDPNLIYASWLLLHIAVIPLVPHWMEIHKALGYDSPLDAATTPSTSTGAEGSGDGPTTKPVRSVPGHLGGVATDRQSSASSRRIEGWR